MINNQVKPQTQLTAPNPPFPKRIGLTRKEKLIKEQGDTLTGAPPVKVNSKIESFKTPMERSDPYYQAVTKFGKTFLRFPEKTAATKATAISSGTCNISGEYFTGVNLATQDYMAMCGDEGAIKAVTDVIRKVGTHSGGVPGRLGYSEYHEELIQTVEWYFDELFGEGRSYEEIGKIRASDRNNTVQKAHGKVFSAGWLAGYGVIQCKLQFLLQNFLPLFFRV